MKKIFIFVWLWAISYSAMADTAGSPLNSTTLTGSAGPFYVPSEDAPSLRYQQVFAASDFAYVARPGVSGGIITEVSFRGGGGAGQTINIDLPNVQISLSTTLKTESSLSPVFAENIGSDSITVFSGPLHFYMNPDPQNPSWNMRISLTQPFTYNWPAGNLLMDIKNFQTLPWPGMEGFGSLNAAYDAGDGASRIYANNVDANTGSWSTAALFTRFTFTPIPEPGSSALFGFGFLMFGSLSLSRLRRVLS